MDTMEFIVHCYLDWISIVFSAVKLQKHAKITQKMNLFHI
jgi:hypothetical protein